MRGPFLARIVTGGLRKPKDPRSALTSPGWWKPLAATSRSFSQGMRSLEHGRVVLPNMHAVPENRVAMKPANSSFEEAASIPVAALTALQGLRNTGQIQPGQQVLI